MEIDINSILENLKYNKNLRTQNSLDRLNQLLEHRFEKNENDYSISSIAKESKASGGVGEVSIRNASGLHYRELINAWVAKADVTMKKKSQKQSRNNRPSTDFELLKKLDDPVLRAIFGQIISQNMRLKTENNILKSKSNIVVDIRPIEKTITDLKKDLNDEPPCKNKFLQSEIDALKDAISGHKINRRGWVVTDSGAVNDENGNPLFKPGFVGAIRKILLSV